MLAEGLGKVLLLANRGVRGLVLLYIGCLPLPFGAAALERGDHLPVRLGIVLALTVATLIPRRWTPAAWRYDDTRRRRLIVLGPLAAGATLAVLGMVEGLDQSKMGIEIWFFGPMAGLILASRWWLSDETSEGSRSAMLLLPFAGFILTVLLVLLGALPLALRY